MGLAIVGRGVLVAVTASTADAQRRRRRAIATQSGPHTAHMSATTSTSTICSSAPALLATHARSRALSTFDYYFMSGGSLWALNFDLKYRPPTRYGAWYVGGGLNWSHSSSGGVSGSDTNLNLLTGLEGRRDGRDPTSRPNSSSATAARSSSSVG